MNADEKISQNDLTVSARYLWRAAMHSLVEELGWVLPDFAGGGNCEGVHPEYLRHLVCLC